MNDVVVEEHKITHPVWVHRFWIRCPCFVHCSSVGRSRSMSGCTRQPWPSQPRRPPPNVCRRHFPHFLGLGDILPHCAGHQRTPNLTI